MTQEKSAVLADCWSTCAEACKVQNDVYLLMSYLAWGCMYSQWLTRKSDTCAVSTVGICNEIFMLDYLLWDSYQDII